jgi:hypothetical protein
LGLLWVLDGALQLQPYMYSRGFANTLTANVQGQPDWLAASIRWTATMVAHNVTALNTLFAVTQLLLGFGLLYRRTVKFALGASFIWAFVVWSCGEGFGMLLAGTPNPLAGAPGAVLLYAMVGLLAWPGDGPAGLLGVRGAKTMWAGLWLIMGWAWLLAANSAADAVSATMNAAPSGMRWLSSVQHAAAGVAKGNGLVIAVTLAAISGAIGLSLFRSRRPRDFLYLAIGLNVAYWVLGQGLGGVVTGSATDPNSAPLFILLAAALYPLAARAGVTRSTAWTRQTARLDAYLKRGRPAAPAAVALATVLVVAVPAALWAVLQMPFARAPAFASSTLDAAGAMPSAHKWLAAAVVGQAVWAVACAIGVARRRVWLEFMCATALVLAAAVAICAGILVAHLVAPDHIGRYNGMPVDLANQPGMWFALVSFVACGSGQLAAGAYAVLGVSGRRHWPVTTRTRLTTTRC